MKTILTLILCLGITAARAQNTLTADQVIDTYLTAIGGKAAIAKVKDMSMDMAAETERGTMLSEFKMKAPNKFVSVMFAMGSEVRRVTGNGGRVSTTQGFGGNNQTQLSDGAKAQGELMQNHPFPELFYDSLGVQRVLLGKESINGAEANKVEFSLGDRKWIEHFDVASGLKVKRSATVETPRGKMDIAQSYSDYKAVEGVKIPYVREMGGRFAMKMEVQSVKINKGIKDKEFEIK